MRTINWMIHYVFGSCPIKNITNYHTHGMEHYGHLDFQLVLNVSDEHAKYLLNTMGMRVQNGEQFKSGDHVNGLYEDCSVRLDEYQESGRTVLRLIIPDENNRFPEDPECSKPYCYQSMHFSE